MDLEKLINWLETRIDICDALGDMKKEKWAFMQTLKEVRRQSNIKK